MTPIKPPRPPDLKSLSFMVKDNKLGRDKRLEAHTGGEGADQLTPSRSRIRVSLLANRIFKYYEMK